MSLRFACEHAFLGAAATGAVAVALVLACIASRLLASTVSSRLVKVVYIDNHPLKSAMSKGEYERRILTQSHTIRLLFSVNHTLAFSLILESLIYLNWKHHLPAVLGKITKLATPIVTGIHIFESACISSTQEKKPDISTYLDC